MFDNILWRYNKKGESDNTLESVAALLDAPKVVVDKNTAEVLTISGYWRGFEIDISVKNGFLLCKGSIAKYYWGSNIGQHTRESARAAFNEIGKELGIKPRDMLIRSLEIGANIVTRKPPEIYAKQMVSAKGFGRVAFDDTESTLYFAAEKGKPKRHKVIAIFYNKKKEARASLQPIPAMLKGCHLLRYEVRIKSRLKEFLKTEPTAAEITRKGCFRLLVEYWRGLYNEIEKRTIQKAEFMENKKTPNEIAEAYKMGIAAMIDSKELEEYKNRQLCIIDQKYKDGEITRKNRDRARKEIELWTNILNEHKADSETIKELDEAINGTAYDNEQ